MITRYHQPSWTPLTMPVRNRVTVYQGTGLSLAYDPSMILDATQLTQSTNNAPGRYESLASEGLYHQRTTSPHLSANSMMIIHSSRTILVHFPLHGEALNALKVSSSEN
jgi:hypothetical protein